MAATQVEPQNPQTSNTNLSKHAWVIGMAMISGLILGLICHELGESVTKPILITTELIVHLFLRLIKMIIAPLVLATLVSGIGNVRDKKTIKTIGLKIIAWFVLISFISLAVGMIAANLIQPGINFTKDLPTVSPTHSNNYHFDIITFILHIVPESIVGAMAGNDMIQIVVFAVMFGLGIAALPEKCSQVIREASDSLGKIMLRVTDMVMKTVPLVVFASLLSIATTNGIHIIEKYGVYLMEFYAVIIFMWGILIGTGYIMIGKKVFKLLPFISEPVLLGFATASSESTFPRLLEQLEKFGVSSRIAGFVVPLGYSFNLCGTMMFVSFAAIFIAQAYGIHMSIDKQIMMLLVMMVSSKGIAGVPRASTVMLATVMPSFGIPEAGLLLIIGIDQFLDMARTATNILGNGIAAAVANEWDIKESKKQEALKASA